MKKTNITKRIDRIVKYSNNAEQTALDTIRQDIGYDVAIAHNPEGVLKLLKNCAKKGETYIGIWDLQFMFEDGKLPIPEKNKNEYAEAIKELSSRLRFVAYVDDEASIDAINLFDDYDEYNDAEDFNDREIIYNGEPDDIDDDASQK